jgi:hypothetical protein
VNTERPDNDDATEPGAAEPTGATRDADAAAQAEERVLASEGASEAVAESGGGSTEGAGAVSAGAVSEGDADLESDAGLGGEGGSEQAEAREDAGAPDVVASSSLVADADEPGVPDAGATDVEGPEAADTERAAGLVSETLDTGKAGAREGAGASDVEASASRVADADRPGVPDAGEPAALVSTAADVVGAGAPASEARDTEEPKAPASEARDTEEPKAPASEKLDAGQAEAPNATAAEAADVEEPELADAERAAGSAPETAVSEVPHVEEPKAAEAEAAVPLAPDVEVPTTPASQRAAASESEALDDDAPKTPVTEQTATPAPGAPDGDVPRGPAAEQAATPASGTPDGNGPKTPVTEQAATPVSGAPAGDAPGTPGPKTPRIEPRSPDEPHTRRRSPAIIASVAAAVLVVGGGGAYLAATASGGAGGGAGSGAPVGDTPPPLTLDGYPQGGSSGIAPGEPNPYGVIYQAAGALADGPGEAPVYRARGEVGQGEVVRLAKALGVEGTPVAQGQAWRVGAKDGSGPSLQVNQQAPGTWTFQRYAPGTDSCESPTVCVKPHADAAVDPVGEEAAKKAAAPVLKAVGQDDTKLDASQIMGAQRVVNADPVIGGLPTYGWTTGVTVSAQGEVVGGSGQLKAPVKGDTYPVLDAEKTLDLMNAAPRADSRAGIGGCASPVPLEDRRMEAPCEETAATGVPKRDTITVENAVFGLASHFVDAKQALVPSWLFEVRTPGAQDSFTVTYPAIDPKYLAPATPSGQPSPRPTGPGDDPTSAPITRVVRVDGYSAEGTELTVVFTGGVCADYKTTASESEDEVTVKVTETSWPDKVCIMIAKEYHQTVQLDEPLGDRKVVDSDGTEVPLEKPGARLPETSGTR